MIIITSKPGRLGNQLFLHAHILAFCLENEIQLINPSFDYALYFPNLKLKPKENGYITHKWFSILNLISKFVRIIKIDNALISQTSIDWFTKFNLDDKDSSSFSKIHFVNGWLYRSPKLLQKFSVQIKRAFAPKPEVVDYCASFIKRVKDPQRLAIAVHIRHEDYISFEGGKYFYEIEYYLKWLEQLEKNAEENIVFIVFSNSSNIESILKKENVFSTRGDVIEDLYLMSCCDYIFGPPSTFSLWASFYGNKPIHQILNKEEILDLSKFSLPSEF